MYKTIKASSRYFSRIKRFFKYFFHDPYFTCVYIFIFLFKGLKYICSVNLFSREELHQQIKLGKSLIRFGDGDIYILNGGDQSYQRYSPRLRVLLQEIITSTKYEMADPRNCIIGVPARYLKCDNSFLRDNNLLQCWLPFKIYFKNYFGNKNTYFDSHIFYEDNSFKEFISGAIKGKNTLFVTNSENISYLKSQEHKFDFTPIYLETKKENSFDDFDALLLAIIDIHRTHNDLKVILSTGTTSKVLAYALSKKGICCYDVGWGIKYMYSFNELSKTLI